MRYQANGANPRAPHEARNGLTTSSDAMNAITKPTRDLQRPARRRADAALPAGSCANAAAIVGIARKNENSAAAGRSSPISMPPTIVAPDRDTPGISASVWQTPMPNAWPIGVSSTSRTSARGRNRSTTSMTMPPSDERDGDHREALVEHALHEVRQQRAGDERREHGDDQHQRETPRLRARRQAGDHVEDLRAVEPHDREDRAELDHHGEHAARIVEAEQALADQQMRRRRHRQELGEALHDAEQRGLTSSDRGHDGQTTTREL